MRRAALLAALTLLACGRMPAEEKFVEATVTDVRHGGTPTYEFPDSIHDETKEAAAAIAKSTSYKQETPGYGTPIMACFNGTLTGPEGERPLAVVMTRAGGHKVVEMSVRHRCQCSGSRSRQTVRNHRNCYLLE